MESDPTHLNFQDSGSGIAIGRLNLDRTQCLGDAVVSISEGHSTAGNRKFRSRDLGCHGDYRTARWVLGGGEQCSRGSGTDRLCPCGGPTSHQRESA